MRLEKYLLVEASGRVKKLSLEEFTKLLPNVSDVIESYNTPNGFRLYRGGSGDGSEDYAIGDGGLGEPRRSANTTNHYTLLLDNLPTWNKFPKRQRSFICSGSSNMADTFGYVKIILPYNGVKIGVCPTEDIWNAYENDGNFPYYDLTGVNSALEVLLRSVLGTDDYDKNWQILSKAINKVDKVSREDIELAITEDMAEATYTLNHVDALKLLDKRRWKGTVMKTLEGLLDPSKFQIVTSKSKSIGDSECWTEGPVLMVSERLESTLPFIGGRG